MTLNALSQDLQRFGTYVLRESLDAQYMARQAIRL